MSIDFGHYDPETQAAFLRHLQALAAATAQPAPKPRPPLLGTLILAWWRWRSRRHPGPLPGPDRRPKP